MIVDSSAIVAMLKSEPEADAFRQALRSSGRTSLSAANYLETGVVIDRDARLSAQLDGLLDGYRVAVVSVTESQARTARQAYRDFGKGSGHKAQLNFGDCFAYALALETGEPLLYKGEDFAATGIRAVLPTP